MLIKWVHVVDVGLRRNVMSVIPNVHRNNLHQRFRHVEDKGTMRQLWWNVQQCIHMVKWWMAIWFSSSIGLDESCICFNQLVRWIIRHYCIQNRCQLSNREQVVNSVHHWSSLSLRRQCDSTQLTCLWLQLSTEHWELLRESRHFSADWCAACLSLHWLIHNGT